MTNSTNELKCTRCEEKLIIDKMNHEISCKNGHVYHNDDIVKNYNIIVNRLREHEGCEGQDSAMCCLERHKKEIMETRRAPFKSKSLRPQGGDKK